MDPQIVLQKVLEFFSTKKGKVFTPIIFESILDGAVTRFRCSKFTAEDCSLYEDSVRVCLTHPPNERCKKRMQQKVLGCTVACVIAFGSRFQKCGIFQTIRFFYKTLIHVEIARNDASIDNLAKMLWSTLFLETDIWKQNKEETKKVLDEMKLLVGIHLQRNPRFCTFMLEGLLWANELVKNLYSRKEYDKKKADLFLLRGRCTYQLMQYDETIEDCKKASELLEYGHYYPFELRAWALLKKGAPELAIKQLNFAVEIEKDIIVQRHLQDQIDQVLRDLRPTSPNITSGPDDQWIDKSHNSPKKVKQHQREKLEDTHKKTKRKLRQKFRMKTYSKEKPALEVTVNKSKIGTYKAKGSFNPLTGSKLDTNDVSKTDENCLYPYYFKWNESGEESSDFEETDKALVFERKEEVQEVRNVKPYGYDKTWFTESQELYNNREDGKRIVCGMFIDVDIDSILRKDFDQTREPFYREMKSVQELEQLMKREPKKYKRCRIELESSHKAICKELSADHCEIEIHGRSKCGQTFNHDEVCVEIFSKNQSQQTSTVLYRRTQEDINTYGCVIGVFNTHFKEEKHPVLACTCDSEEGFLMHPLCNSVPKIHVLNSMTKKNYPSFQKYKIDTYKVDQKELKFKGYFDVKPSLRGRYVFLVVYLTWGRHHVYPLGAVIDVLECGTDYYGGLKILEMKYNVPLYYERDTVKHIASMKKKPIVYKDREDCRDLTVFTIDPQNSKDLDDALSICTEDDHFIVGVHIADVAVVVKKGDPVDTEAKRRATSFYPSDSKVRHMLPEPLSENLCSLLPKEERCTLSLFFKLDKSGTHVEETKVKKTIIRSCQQLSYEEAQKIIDGENVKTVCKRLQESIQLLHEIAQNLRKERMANSRFFVPLEDPRFMDQMMIETTEAHIIVEEFMIKANTFIGKWIREKYPGCVPIMCQSEPSREKLKTFDINENRFLDLVVALQGQEVGEEQRKVGAKYLVEKGNTVKKDSLPIQRNAWFQILDGVQHGKLEDAMKALCKDEVHPFQAVALDHWRSIMDTAEYRCSEKPEKDLSHFSLQTKLYTHFTSPIRRFVDLVVHRLVHAALEERPCPYTSSEIAEMCANVNNASFRQKNFSHGCQALKRAQKMAKEPMVFHAFVKQVTENSAQLCIPSLKHASVRSKEVPFNLLDLSKKPEMRTDAQSNKGFAWGKWKKRLYDCRGCPSQLRYSEKLDQQEEKKQKIIVNPYQHVVFVDSQTWAEILSAYFKQDTKTIRKLFNTQSRKGQNPPRGPPMRDILTSEFGNGKVKSHQCRFEYSFAPGQVLKVQMVANPVQGILTPQVRLLHISKNLTLCMSHMVDPVGELTQYATESSKKTIRSLEEYQRVWLPLLEMEAAKSAIHSEKNVIIDNVKLTFKNIGNSMRPILGGEFILSSKFVIDRCIEFGGKDFDYREESDAEDDSLDSDLSTVDYLCIRCQVEEKASQFEYINKVIEVPCSLKRRHSEGKAQKPRAKFFRRKKVIEVQCSRKSNFTRPNHSSSVKNPYTWVGHGRIVGIKKKKNQQRLIKVIFTLNTISTEIPETFFPTTFGTVEVMFKSVVDRTSMAKVQQIESCPLASSLASNSSPPPLDPKRKATGSKIRVTTIGKFPSDNTKQLKSIMKALTSSFSLIQGPPGTGKTYTGIKLLYLFNKINKEMCEDTDKKKEQVLFCGPSNKSVDLVARLMLEKLGSDCPNIIRVYGTVHESVDYPIPKTTFETKRSLRDIKSDKFLKSVTLHHMVRQEQNSKSSELRRYDRLFSKKPQLVKMSDIRKYKDILFSACCEELSKCDIILCTCAVGGSIKLSVATNICQVVIDECAMSTEPQAMVPIIATKAKQVVLIGDHKQLRPIVQCKEAAELGLARSLFERFAEQATFLDTQYRMHPEICYFPSQEFYGGKLITARSSSWMSGYRLSLWPRKEIPHVFCHVEGTEEALSVSTDEGNEQSKFNHEEAQKVCDIFKWMIEKERINGDKINMMSQYNAQCSKIKQNLEMYFDKNRTCINVNTVVASQGGEWDYVIFSTVRSLPEYKIEKNPTFGWSKQNLGFITDANQINVALTRARKGLIIIGNKHLLKSDKVLGKLITNYQERGCLVDGKKFPQR